VFIRAPVVEEVGPDVEVLASLPRPDGSEAPVLCRQGRHVVAAFHPELSGDGRIHELFVASVRR
jgi:5'-phosphate synthase pdxT subunit